MSGFNIRNEIKGCLTLRPSGRIEDENQRSLKDMISVVNYDLSNFIIDAINEKLEREERKRRIESFEGVAEPGMVGANEIVVESEWYWLNTAEEKDEDGSDLSMLEVGKKYRVTIEEIEQ